MRRELQERFTHVFVDEFQDTDPLQAEILLLLAADDATVSDWTVATPRPGNSRTTSGASGRIPRAKAAATTARDTG